MLGIAGLVGSGRTELARLIYGADPKAAGEVLLDGQAVNITRPKDALDRGLAYLTEDRKRLGLFLDMSCGENINVGVIDRDARGYGVLNLASAKRRAEEAFKALRVRAASPLVTVGSLSGGNQQKVLLSRWLEIGPKVLILDEPTRGVDIGAKSEIYRIIDELAQKGIGVIVISSELPEIIGICDRVLVMREGHIEGEVGGPSGKPITQENIMALAAGVRALTGRRATGRTKMAKADTSGAAAAPSGGAGLSAQQVRMRGDDPGARHAAHPADPVHRLPLSVGRPVLHAAEHLDRGAAGLDQHRARGRHDLRHPDRRHRPVGGLDPGGLGHGGRDLLA